MKSTVTAFAIFPNAGHASISEGTMPHVLKSAAQFRRQNPTATVHVVWMTPHEADGTRRIVHSQTWTPRK